MVGGGVNHDEGCGIHHREARRQRHAQGCRCQGVGAKTTGAAQAGHGLAYLQVLYAFTDCLHDACVFRAGHKGQGRLHLVLVLHDQQVGEIQAGGLDFNQHLARLGLGRGSFGPGQGVDAHRVFTKPSVHEKVSKNRWPIIGPGLAVVRAQSVSGVTLPG